MTKKTCSCEQCVEVFLSRDFTGYSSTFLQVDQAFTSTRNVYLVDHEKMKPLMKSLSLPIIDYSLWDDSFKKEMRKRLNPLLFGRSNKHELMPKLTVTDLNSGASIIEKIMNIFSSSGRYEITFGNGRHRTEFLLANGAQYIPIQMNEYSASYFNRLYGDKTCTPASL